MRIKAQKLILVVQVVSQVASTTERIIAKGGRTYNNNRMPTLHQRSKLLFLIGAIISGLPVLVVLFKTDISTGIVRTRPIIISTDTGLMNGLSSNIEFISRTVLFSKQISRKGILAEAEVAATEQVIKLNTSILCTSCPILTPPDDGLPTFPTLSNRQISVASRGKYECLTPHCLENLTPREKGEFTECFKECFKVRRKYGDITNGGCHFMNGKARLPVALASFPGSGNTWTRGLLEKITGVCTGNNQRLVIATMGVILMDSEYAFVNALIFLLTGLCQSN